MTITYFDNSVKIYSDLLTTFVNNQDSTLTVKLYDCCEDKIYDVNYIDGLMPQSDAEGIFITIPDIYSAVNTIILSLTTDVEIEEKDCIYVESLLDCTVIDRLNTNLENLAVLEALRFGNQCSGCYCDDICLLYKSLFNNNDNDCQCN